MMSPPFTAACSAKYRRSVCAPAIDYIDSIFAPALASELLAGGTGHHTAHRRLLFQQSLQAAICRASADSLHFILHDSRPAVQPRRAD